MLAVMMKTVPPARRIVVRATAIAAKPTMEPSVTMQIALLSYAKWTPTAATTAGTVFVPRRLVPCAMCAVVSSLVVAMMSAVPVRTAPTVQRTAVSVPPSAVTLSATVMRPATLAPMTVGIAVETMFVTLSLARIAEAVKRTAVFVTMIVA